MRMFHLLIAGVLFVGFGTHARADEAPSPEALQAANELFTIVSGDTLKQLATQITKAFWPSVEQSARAEKIDDATIAEIPIGTTRIATRRKGVVVRSRVPHWNFIANIQIRAPRHDDHRRGAVRIVDDGAGRLNHRAAR